MAYPNYFPVGYQPAQVFYPQYQVQQNQPNQQTQMQQPQYTQQTPPIQQSGFVRVQSENEARMYPVAPGNSVTFIDENAPYCYTKTMDFSQLDRPKFDKYRLVKEEDAPVAPQSGSAAPSNTDIAYAEKSDVEALRREIDTIKARLEKKKPKKRDEEDEDDE